MENNPKYWIAVLSQEHIRRGISDDFIQVCHGKRAPLKRMKKDDYIIVYSSKKSINSDEKLHKFTAIGKAKDDNTYLYQMSENFIPYRRNIEYFDCNEISILPLIPKLEFIEDKKSWGYPFRYGFLEINKHDFELISSKMLENG